MQVGRYALAAFEREFLPGTVPADIDGDRRHLREILRRLRAPDGHIFQIREREGAQIQALRRGIVYHRRSAKTLDLAYIYRLQCALPAPQPVIFIIRVRIRRLTGQNVTLELVEHHQPAQRRGVLLLVDCRQAVAVQAALAHIRRVRAPDAARPVTAAHHLRPL